MPDSPLTVRVAGSIDRIASRDWDWCAGADNPFVGHAFLKALEDSGSVGSEAGWLPVHLAAEDGAGRVLGVVPLYAKSHSYGEYVFDHAWAHAYERAGGDYYPKLQVAVPFTPVTGPRLLLAPGAPEGVAAGLIRALERVAHTNRFSSVHVTFPTETEWQRLGTQGWLLRTGQQFHWFNAGYTCFDDFLSALNSRKRKAIRKERRTVADSPVRIHTLTGDDLRPEHWDAFFQFYMDTSDRKWGMPYLTRDFFHRLGSVLADRVVLFLAEEDGMWVAGALNLRGSDALYGRNWGAIADYKFLHFEACYYCAIDFAIAHGLKRVEAGAQGEHKIQRGYLPQPTFSAHWFRDPSFRKALSEYLDHERDAMACHREELGEASPFRKTGEVCSGDAGPKDPQ